MELGGTILNDFLSVEHNPDGTLNASGSLASKQDVLVSGTNIKTINSTSILGSGDISISSIAGITGTTAQFNTALTDNDFATQAGSETLTNKTISGSSNTISNIAESSVTNLTSDLASKVNHSTTITSGGASSGWLLGLNNNYAVQGTDPEPIMVQTLNAGSYRRAFWLNESGSPRAASVQDESALKIFGPEANPAYNGMLLDMMLNYTTQTHVFGINMAGQPIIGSSSSVGGFVLALSGSTPVPSGTPAGTLIVRY